MTYRLAPCLAIAAITLSGCAYNNSPQATESGSQVGATGDVKYSHEPLGNNKHLLTVTAAPGMMETEGSISQRILIFANRFAARTCPGAFDFVNDPNFSQPPAGGFMQRTRTFVFICKP